MRNEETCPKTLHNAVKHFAKPNEAFNFLVAIRWPHGVHCPRCRSKDVRFISTRQIWECKRCDNKQFSAKVGTIFEDSPISLEKWFCAIWLLVNAKNGISSYELHRSIGVTQKTGWFMLQRIRLAMQNGSVEKFSGRVEADETYIGAKARNMHKDKRLQKGTGTLSKTAVLGLLERETSGKPARVRCKVMRGIKVRDLDPEVRAKYREGFGSDY
jgi:transposase-like protein